MLPVSDRVSRRKATVRCLLALGPLAVFCLCVPRHALAQEARATLSGRVTDPQGAAVPSAIVVVMSNDTGVTRQTQTNGQENWIVEDLLQGAYQSSVAASGFSTMER